MDFELIPEQKMFREVVVATGSALVIPPVKQVKIFLPRNHRKTIFRLDSPNKSLIPCRLLQHESATNGISIFPYFTFAHNTIPD